MSFSRLSWYWHRLRAMSPAELGGHVRKKLHQFKDARGTPDWAALPLESSGGFPKLPEPAAAPALLKEGLRRDADDILHGRWRAFGHLEIKVDDPPRWHTDYLIGKNLATNASAFKLNHRQPPGGADVKLIWELSRWYQLVRLAQAAYVLGDARAAQTCIRWLADWVTHNPPYRGWNWTSALEVGLRLIQFTWIDALLCAQAEAWGVKKELERLRQEVLPAHVWFAWRHKSFGSSANNHLLGELVGLIAATARWPALAQCGASLETLQAAWETEVLAQFAEDGGNREQALNYQLFSWEFCWQAQAALMAAGRTVSFSVMRRLELAVGFFAEVQVEGDPWDYGDSDNAFVTPFFAHDRTATAEWRNWFYGSEKGAAILYWWGRPPSPSEPAQKAKRQGDSPERGGTIYDESRIAIDHWNLWTLRLDLSPLGYRNTAAHGHLDALHLSIWYRGVAMIIDPGTGAYYADKELRAFLASWDAHNGPHPVGLDFPKRLGPFLWSKHHPVPVVRYHQDVISGQLLLPGGRLQRQLVRVAEDRCWRVEDSYEPSGLSGNPEFTVRWQFAPGSWVKRVDERKFSLHRADVCIVIEADASWAEVNLVERASENEHDLEGIVSPAFRKTVWAPYLKLTARPGKKPGVFRTTFRASEPS